MSDDFQPGAAPDQWPGGPSGEAGNASGQPLAAGTISVVSSGPTIINLSATDATGGTPGYTYQWGRSDSILGPFSIIGNGLLTLTDTGLTAGTTYFYQIVYTDADGATDTASKTVATTGELSIEPHYLHRLIFDGTGSVLDGATILCRWLVARKDGGLVNPLVEATITIKDPNGAITGPFSCEVEANNQQPSQIMSYIHHPTAGVLGLYVVEAFATLDDGQTISGKYGVWVKGI